MQPCEPKPASPAFEELKPTSCEATEKPAGAKGFRQRRGAVDAIGKIVALALCFLAGFFSVLAASPVSSNRPPDLQALMRDVARNELRARQEPAHYYEDLVKEETPSSSQTSLRIGTRQGRVSRLVEVNGKPPDEKQCRNHLDLLDRIAASPALQQARLRSQLSEMDRREQLFAAMPAAFLFQYEGIEKSTGWLRIRYWPNPEFRPRDRVGGVLLGLEGTLWIDSSSKRLARIQGKLNKDVTFGWGILARLNRGGQFMLAQTKIADGTWQETALFVNFHGSILFFKKFEVDMKETVGSHKEVPDTLTVAQAVDMLKRAPVHCLGR